MKKYSTNVTNGLSKSEVETRIQQGLVNYDANVKSKQISEIIRDNTLTLFNFLNLGLGLAIFLVASYKNLLFLGVVFCNTLIGIIQEIYAKKIIDKLNLLKDDKVTVVRDGTYEKINVNEIVIDDVVLIKNGNQIICDAIILDGICEVNEAFITGESVSVSKKAGDELLSGSFIVSGEVRAQIKHVGEDNYIAKITKEAKVIKKSNSELMRSLNKIIKVVSIIIVPMGILLFYQQYTLPNNDLTSSVVNTVAALIGMIPEGLILLTSTVLAVSVIRLAKYKVLIQDLFSIESLARIDTLCLDKTGTLTSGDIELVDVIIYDKSRKVNEFLSVLANNLDENSLTKAISAKYNITSNLETSNIIYFSSEKKWSGLEIKQQGTFVIGAPEFVFRNNYEHIKKDVDQYASKYRVIVLAHSNYGFVNNELPKNLKVLALLLFRDQIREEVVNTLDYFNEQDVKIKIISGDNVLTVAGIASRVGIDVNNNYIDVSMLTDIELIKLADNYDIFGRVSPKQKKIIVNTLQKNGHIVGFVGDGVNDVLALKEADCSIALSAGSEAACNVSKLVLLDSNFNSMPQIVTEGRRTINNIERSATLFLVKTTYATILAFLFLFINKSYPFMPIQLTLTSVFTIGIPSFILALEPNNNRIKGNFLTNVISRAIPTALTIVINIILIMIISSFFNFTEEQSSTLAVILTGFTGFMLLYHISKPFNLIRTALLVSMITLFTIGIIGLRNLFSLTILTPYMGAIIALLISLSVVNFRLMTRLYYKIRIKYHKWFK